MTFLWPFMLTLLLLIPALIIVYILLQRRRQKYALRYASLSLVKEALGRGPGWRRHVPAAIFLMALTAMIFALARPEMETLVPSAEGTIILTVDVSGSMTATDLQPNRMEAAKAAARAFVEKQPETVQVGIVSFSDNAFVVQPPTDDKDALLSAINRLNYQRGTAIGRGLVASLEAIAEKNGEPSEINLNPDEDQSNNNNNAAPQPTPMPKGQYQNAIIVLLTDGENNQWPEPVEIAQIAADRGIRVYTVGIGSEEGAIVRIQGRAIRTRLDEQTLRTIAEMTDGIYYNAQTETDLVKVYETLSTNLVLKTDTTEVTAYVTAIAAVLSLLAGFLSLMWFNRLP
ncbi:MAG: VWA domain-containing protein [Anaerolineae bacterium]|nr:VWA domain-containing protein [Anaerolineae bacterium]